MGLELSGARWGREKDRLGFAGGSLSASNPCQADAANLGADGPDFGYLPSGTALGTSTSTLN